MLGTAFAPHALAAALTAAALGPVPPPPPSPPSVAGSPVAGGSATNAPAQPAASASGAGGGTAGAAGTSPAVAAAATPASIPATGSTAPLDFIPVTQTLARVAACAAVGKIPEQFDVHVVDRHCQLLASLEAKWRQTWLAQAQPFFAAVVPRDIPPTVVYPFGGGDLLTALVVYPNATEITTLSLEPAGDPRSINALAPGDLDPMLSDVRDKVNHLLHYGHSKTTDMGKLAKSKLPGDLTYALAALEINHFDPVSVRFFRLSPQGEVIYMTGDDIANMPESKGRRSPFANLEIQYVPRGGGGRRTFRHIAANLDDKHMAADPSVLRHLEPKGPIAAITKAASYLLWWNTFSQIREYLLRNMVWMISDSTGIPPDEATAAGFEQIPYGQFDGPFLGGGIRPTEVFRKLWADKAQPLAFRFGYPDVANHDHLLITRRLPR